MDSFEKIPSKLSLNNNIQNQNNVLKKRSRESHIRICRNNQGIENENKSVSRSCDLKKKSVSASDLLLKSRIVIDESIDKLPTLRDITNNRFLDEEEKTKSRQHRKNSEIALERWKILAKALIKPEKSSRSFKPFKSKDLSSRKFTSFELIKPVQIETFENFDGYWLIYSAEILGITYKVQIHHIEQKLTLQDLVGFNNTGNICIWPSEEVLAFYLLSHLHSFDGKDVLEVGGGMTCLAGLMVACHGKARRVDLTDGNLVSVENVKNIIQKNNLNEDNVKSFQLNWINHRQLTEKYDVVLSSDCLFFDETRADLVETIWHSLKTNGVAFVMAPKRGNTLDSFIKLAKARGFYCILRTHYDDTVWKQHIKFKESTFEYNENLHYPFLLLLTKFSQEISDL